MAVVKQVIRGGALALKNESALARTFWIVTFALLTGIGAQIEIPHYPVPYTLQTFFVILAGGMLGRRDGALSMGLYVTLGLLGLPLFAGGGLGLARILGPTGGYILGFPIAAFLIGLSVSILPEKALQQKSAFARSILTYAWLVGGLGIGLVAIFLLGTAQLNFVLLDDWQAAFQSGFLIFSWWDLLKLCAAAAILMEFRR